MTYSKTNAYVFKFANEEKDSIEFGNPLKNPKLPFLLHIQMEYCFANLKQVIEEDKTVKYDNDKLIMDWNRYNSLCELLVEILKILIIYINKILV